MKLLQILSALCLASLLVACGGGGGVALGALVGAVLPDSSTPNKAPVANAGVTQNISLGFTGGIASKVVTLNGTSSSDANGDKITFKWFLTQKPAGSLAELSNATEPNPTFTADVAGIYRVSLIVNDGKLDSETPSVVTISASIDNSTPIANAGVKQFVIFGASRTVTLDGTYSSDADSDQITYKWILMQKPSGSGAALTGATTSRPTFIADLAGDYVAQLIVNDGKVDSTPGSVIVNAAAANVQPVADAGIDQNVTVNTLVTLDGTNSTDANFDTLTYKWDWIAHPGTAPTLAATSPKPTFSPSAAGTYVLTLTVNDGKLSSTADPISITVSATNSVPVAATGADQYVLVSALVTLDGSSSTDADKLDILSYKWTLNKPVGSTASLSSATAQKPTFTADAEGVYVASLVVSDSKSDSSNQALTRVTASTVANSPPVANAGTAQTVTTTATVTLAGSATDANSDTLTYKWYLVTKPTGSLASLSLSTTLAPTFTPDQVGIYVVVLIANDGKVDSAPSSVTITRSS
jgi:hypothetical protein